MEGRGPLVSKGNLLARRLFAGVAGGYDLWAEFFSLLQYRHWHSALLTALKPRPGEKVLDVSTGTGAVAIDLAQAGCRVVGLDISSEMLREGQRRVRCGNLGSVVQFVEGNAEQLPFRSEAFDTVTFTFLLRYIADPERPVQEMIRVLRPGGRLAMLEFAVPPPGVVRHLWTLYAFRIMPELARFAPNGWRDMSLFLGPSIRDFTRRSPIEVVEEIWADLGLEGTRTYRLSLGGAFVMTGRKPA